MLAGLWREIDYLLKHKWDCFLAVLAPLLVILLFTSMFAKGKPEHLPIAIIDQDRSALSSNIQHYLSASETLHIAAVTDQPAEAEQLLNKNKIWGYVHIPAGAEQRLVQAKDAEISIAFNQSYFSVGNTVSSAMLSSTLQALANFTGRDYLNNRLPYLEAPSPHVKISALYNPGLNYEFYLEPYMIPAILHLLLCCCVAFSVGQEFKFQTEKSWLQSGIWQALLSKNLCYIIIFSLWTWLWMFWLMDVRGWFAAGHVWLIMLAQLIFYSAYAFISSALVLATGNLSKTFGIIAVYGGSSLSFAGVTLPLNNAPLFTKFWANIIPYTPYAKLQTEQWVIGSPIASSLQPLLALCLYAAIWLAVSYALLIKRARESSL